MFRAAAISGFKISKFFQAVWGGVRNGQLRHPAEARRSVVGLRLTGKSQMCVANLAPLFGGAFSVGRCATNRQPAPLMRRACWSPSRNGNLCDGKHQVAGKPTLPLRRMARADLAEPAGESKSRAVAKSSRTHQSPTWPPTSWRVGCGRSTRHWRPRSKTQFLRRSKT